MVGAQCTETTKSCEEYEKGKNDCQSLNAGDDKRCLLDVNGKW